MARTMNSFGSGMVSNPRCSPPGFSSTIDSCRMWDRMSSMQWVSPPYPRGLIGNSINEAGRLHRSSLRILPLRICPGNAQLWYKYWDSLRHKHNHLAYQTQRASMKLDNNTSNTKVPRTTPCWCTWGTRENYCGHWSADSEEIKRFATYNNHLQVQRSIHSATLQEGKRRNTKISRTGGH